MLKRTHKCLLIIEIVYIAFSLVQASSESDWHSDGYNSEFTFSHRNDKLNHNKEENESAAKENESDDNINEDVKDDDSNRSDNVDDTESKEKLNIRNKREPGFDLTPEEMQKFKIWKDGVIPYFIDVVSFSDKVSRDKIRSVLHSVNAATSLSFMELPTPPTDDSTRWVFFMNRRALLGCADHTVKNFTNTGVQRVILGYSCMATKGELTEAVMSIAGVPAQHNAPNRDKYIRIRMDNVLPDKKYLFDKLNDNEWLFHDLKYDYDSITHFDVNKYSADGKATVIPTKRNKLINPPTTFSQIDLLKIKMLYNYITRNKKLKMPDCEKLFEPGKNSNKPIPDTIVKPRKKPNKYLNLPDDEDKPKASDNEEARENGDGKNDVNTLVDQQNNNENKEKEELKLEYPSTALWNVEEITPSQKTDNLNLKGKPDPLSLLSDYHTDDERYNIKVRG